MSCNSTLKVSAQNFPPEIQKLSQVVLAVLVLETLFGRALTLHHLKWTILERIQNMTGVVAQ